MRTYNPSVKQVCNCKCSIRNQMGMAAKGAHVMSCTWESKSTWNPYNGSISEVCCSLLFSFWYQIFAADCLILDVCRFRMSNVHIQLLNVHRQSICQAHGGAAHKQGACGIISQYLMFKGSKVQCLPFNITDVKMMFNVHIQLMCTDHLSTKHMLL